jgi:hypothetical protein
MPTLLVFAGVMTLCALIFVLFFPAVRAPLPLQQPSTRLPSVIILALVSIGLIAAGWYWWWATLVH